MIRALGVALVLAIAAVALGLIVRNEQARKADRECSAVGAEPVRVGGGRFLCITPDGRVLRT